jgi:hypothetical protein
MKTPRAATVHDTIRESGRVLPHPSARLPQDTMMAIHRWHMHYLDVHPLGMVGYHPTWQDMKLLSLRDPINLVSAST